MKTHAVLDAYVALGSSYVKRTPEKKVKRNESRGKCVRFRYLRLFQYLRFTHNAMFLKYIINFGTGKLEVYKHF